MKIITIQQTKTKSGFTATVNGFDGATCIASDEVTALKHLVELLETKNPNFIQRSDWIRGKDKV